MNFSLNRELKRFNRNPNDPSAKARLNYVLTGKPANRDTGNLTNRGELRNPDGEIVRPKSSAEKMNDLIARLNIVNNKCSQGKLSPAAARVVNNVQYIDEAGNRIYTTFNAQNSKVTNQGNYFDMRLKNPMDKFHENAHLLPKLRACYRDLQSNGMTKSHSTDELQQLEGITDLYGMQAYNNWVKLKNMPKRFFQQPVNLINYRNNLEYNRKMRYINQLRSLQGTPLYNAKMNVIKSKLPDNILSNINGYFQARPNEQLEYTEPGLYEILCRAQNSHESPDELLKLLRH